MKITKIIISRQRGHRFQFLKRHRKALSVLDVMRTTLGRDSRFPMARRNEEDEEMKRTHRDTLHTYYARAGVRARGGVFARAPGCSRAPALCSVWLFLLLRCVALLCRVSANREGKRGLGRLSDRDFIQLHVALLGTASKNAAKAK